MNDWAKHHPNLPAQGLKKESPPVETGEASDKQALVNHLATRLSIPELGAAVFLVVDCSTSMNDATKLARAKSGAIEFAESASQKGYAVGLVQFADSASVVIEPSRRLVDVRAAVQRLTAKGSTNMAEGLLTAGRGLAKREGARAVVLVTDGEANSKPEALRAAQDLKELHIEIIAIGTDDADQAFLQRIATRSDLASVVSMETLDKAIAKAAQSLALPRGS